eukprot:gene17163-51710_t
MACTMQDAMQDRAEIRPSRWSAVKAGARDSARTPVPHRASPAPAPSPTADT